MLNWMCALTKLMWSKYLADFLGNLTLTFTSLFRFLVETDRRATVYFHHCKDAKIFEKKKNLVVLVIIG